MSIPGSLLTQIATGDDDQIVAFFRKVRDEHGSEWLAAIQKEYPSASWLADLVANKTADEAFAEVCREYPLAKFLGTQLKTLHAKLRHEIEVKR